MIGNELMRMALPILDALNREYEAVFVGGCVRDLLLGDDVTDVDIATSALPEQVMTLFPRTLPTGLQHGTVTVVTEQGHYEVTTYRKESAYEQFRRPGSVEFIPSLTEDLRRRDYTINALAMRADGTLVDPFGGQEDLARRVIRCVGDPDARLQEDALRMLRGIRFAARLGAEIEAQTWQAMLRHRQLLRHIAMERVGVELDKMVGGQHPAAAIRLLSESGLLACAKEPLAIADKLSDADVSSLHTIEAVDARWSALCILAGLDAPSTADVLRTLRYAVRRADAVSAAVAFHQRVLAANGSEDEAIRETWVRAIIDIGRPAAALWLDMLESGLLPAVDGLPDPVQLRQWLDELYPATLKELALGGDEVQQLLERRPGPWMKPLLQRLLVAAALGQVHHTKEALAAYVLSCEAEELS